METPKPEARPRRGRPPYEATDADREKVRMLVALGWSQERIASAVHLTGKTLRKHFSPELKPRDVMRDRLEADRLGALFREAMGGRITAIRELGRVLGADRMRAEEAEAEAAPPGEGERPGPVPPAKGLGKKEANRIAAMEAEEELARLYGGRPN